MSIAANNPMLTTLLREVSRSFYLTLRVLPVSIRPQIGLAYLLARTTDTIADTELVPIEQRLASLAALRRRIVGEDSAPLDFGLLANSQGSPAEKTLLEKCEQSLSLLGQLTPEDRKRVIAVLDIIISGQELDLRRFGGASADRICALASASELDDYTYRVAGCVGEFWTRMCRAHVFPRAQLDDTALVADGVRFGKGLQLVNILRDLPRDLRQGRCYLPAPDLARLGLAPPDLLDPACESRLRPGYNTWLDTAEGHLRAGWNYTNRLPWRCIRVRLACAWPLMIGFETLSLLRSDNMLDPGRRIKVSRARVRRLMWRSIVRYPFPAWWKAAV